jgi:hypothetical protein
MSIKKRGGVRSSENSIAYVTLVRHSCSITVASNPANLKRHYKARSGAPKDYAHERKGQLSRGQLFCPNNEKRVKGAGDNSGIFTPQWLASFSRPRRQRGLAVAVAATATTTTTTKRRRRRRRRRRWRAGRYKRRVRAYKRAAYFWPLIAKRGRKSVVERAEGVARASRPKLGNGKYPGRSSEDPDLERLARSPPAGYNAIHYRAR